MLSKSKSKPSSLFKYALLIPTVVGMLFYSSCSEEENNTVKQGDNLKQEQLLKLEALIEKHKKNGNINQSVKNKSITFTEIDEIPIFPGCEGEENNRKCFSDHIKKLVAQNFNINIAKDLNYTGTVKLSVFFKISEEGTLKNIKARATHPELEKEAIRVVKMLPKLTPGKHEGKAVMVPYYLPIKFEIKE